MALQPSQPQSIGGVLDTTFQLYKTAFARAVPLCLLLVVASSPPSIYAVTRGALQVMGDPAYWLIYTVSMVAVAWVIGALYLKVSTIGAAAQIGDGEALQAALGRLLPLVLSMILYFIAVTIGTLLLLVPGLILTVTLILAFNLVLLEGKGPIEALRGSHRLVWGDWWRTTAVLAVAFIITMVIYMLAGALVAAVLPLTGASADDLFMVSMLSALGINALTSVLLTPFFISLILAIYWDLKLRKEGGDLAARVDALNAA